MNKRRHLGAAMILLGITAALPAGCGLRGQGQYGTLAGGASWYHAADDPIPGIDRGNATTIRLWCGRGDGIPLVIWSDLNGGSHHGSGTTALAYVEGSHSGSGGRRVDYQCETRDGLAATVTIAGVNYDLANGALFLVSTQGDKPEVAQLPIDIGDFCRESGLGRTLDAKQFAAEHPEVLDFFKKRKPAKTRQ